MSERYLKKIEILERELEYLNSHEMAIIKEALERIVEFAEVLFKIVE